MRAFCFSGGNISSHQVVLEPSLENDLGTFNFFLAKKSNVALGGIAKWSSLLLLDPVALNSIPDKSKRS